MKILHSADWHLDSPILGRTREQTQFLKEALLQIPMQVAEAARQEDCGLLLLSGDLFDGPSTPESRRAVREALEEAGVPVFISPGNHDHYGPDSPWYQETWPENVHIFTRESMESIPLPALDCRIWGAAFTGPEASGLLEGFHAQGPETWQLGVLHGDPTQAASPYCGITAGQIRASGLSYLALGHIHKGGSLTLGDTLCAWPGCPMGRGFDETGPKGVLIVTLEENRREARFLPLDTPRFYDEALEAGADAAASLAALLPASGNADFYRVSFTGESEPLDLEALERRFSRFPNLRLRDRTVPPLDLWAAAGSDTLEGIYFGLLREALEDASEADAQRILLAAKLSRQLLEGQEVRLP